MRTLKGYRALDLAFLAILGAILEGIATKCGGYVFINAPTITISFLIVFIAVVRWNAWGIMISPILAIGTIVGGRFIGHSYLEEVYSWQLYISIVLGLLVVGLNALIYKKYSFSKLSKNIIWILLLIGIDYLFICTIQMFAYRLLTNGSLITTGSYIVTYGSGQQYNLYALGESGLVYNLMGLAITVAGVLVLKAQGTARNVKERLLEEKKEAELRRNSDNFTIADVPEEESPEDSKKSSQ